MRKLLPHKGIVLRLHACLGETCREINRNVLFGEETEQMITGVISLFFPPSLAFRPPQLTQSSLTILWSSGRTGQLSNQPVTGSHRSTESQYLRMLNALRSRTASTLSRVERRCKSQFAAHQLWTAGKSLHLLEPCCPYL